MKYTRNEKSFTLIETVAASVLLSLSVVVLAGISVHSLRTAKEMTVYEQAWDLADRQLTMIDYMGIEDYLLLDGPTEGVFSGDGAEFTWTIDISETTQEFLYDVKVTVGWVEQRQLKTIRAQTRFSGY
jgi:type II secretory pathway pseudopilin PulG